MKSPKVYPLVLLYTSISIALLVIISSYAGSELLITLSPGLVSMNPFTAITFILAATALLLIYKGEPSRKKYVVNILSIIVVITGLLKVITSLSIGGHQMNDIFLTPILKRSRLSSSMAITTSINFVITGIGIFTLNRKRENAYLSDLCGLFISFISLLSLTGYLYNVQEFHRFSGHQPMTFLTAVCFILLSFVLFSYEKNKGFTKEITSNYGGKKIASILIPVTLIVGFGLGFLKLYVDRTNYLSPSFTTALVSISSTVICIFFIWMICASINRSNLSLAKEISERRKIENELQKSNAFLDTVIENIPDMVFVKDAENFCYLKINKAGERFLNGKREALLGKTNFHIFKPDEATYMNTTDKQLMDTGELVYIPEESLTVDNEKRWISTKKIPIRVASRNITHIVGISHDITEQKKQHEIITQFYKELERQVQERTLELQQSEQKFKSLIENGIDVFKMMNADGTIFYASTNHERVLGFSPEEIIDRNWLSCIHGDDYALATNILRQVQEGPGTLVPFTLRFLNKEGNYIWTEGNISNRLHDNNVNAIICNAHDISARLQSENEKRNLEMELYNQQLERQKQVIQATIDGQEKERTAIGMELHDHINQLLGVTKLYIGIGLSVPTSAREMLEKSNENIILSINEIKKLSKALVSPNLSKGLVEAVNDLIEDFEKGSEMKFTCTGLEMVSNRLSAKKQLAMYRIVQELIMNIIKHAKAKNVVITFKEVDNHIFLSVEDDGIGIDLTAACSGIGLRNIKTRVEVLKGKLEIRSEKNQGSSITVTIPIKDLEPVL